MVVLNTSLLLVLPLEDAALVQEDVAPFLMVGEVGGPSAVRQ
jgi:hypothetical protein